MRLGVRLRKAVLGAALDAWRAYCALRRGTRQQRNAAAAMAFVTAGTLCWRLVLEYFLPLLHALLAKYGRLNAGTNILPTLSHTVSVIVVHIWRSS